MNLAEYPFPEVRQIDMAFPTYKTEAKLLVEAESRDLAKGRKEFTRIFYNGGEVKLQPDVKGTWKENAWRYCRAFMGSFEPKHGEKESICAMLMEECLIIE